VNGPGHPHSRRHRFEPLPNRCAAGEPLAIAVATVTNWREAANRH